MYQPASYRSDARICKIIPVNERQGAISIFEVFNTSNSWSPTSMTTQAYIESKACCAYGFGASDAMNPDGTQARRMQVRARFVFRPTPL